MLAFDWGNGRGVAMLFKLISGRLLVMQEYKLSQEEVRALERRRAPRDFFIMLDNLPLPDRSLWDLFLVTLKERKAKPKEQP